MTQIVTHQLQRDVTKIQTLTEIGLPVLAWLLGLQERGSIGFLYISHPIKWLSESPKLRKIWDIRKLVTVSASCINFPKSPYKLL